MTANLNTRKVYIPLKEWMAATWFGQANLKLVRAGIEKRGWDGAIRINELTD